MRRLSVLVLAMALATACSGGPPRGAGLEPRGSSPEATSVGAAPSSRAPASLAPLSPPVKVRAGTVGAVSDVGIYIAMERGYFAEQGIDLDLTNFDSAARMVAPMASGQLEVGGGGLSTGLLNAIMRDIPLVLVADKGRNSRGHSYAALVVRKDLVDSGAVKDYADLKGRKVAVANLGGGSELQMELALKKGGLTLDDVELVGLNQSDMLVAYGNKSLDASILLEPGVLAGVKRGLIVRLKGADEFDATFGAYILYAPHFVREQPEAARRWMVAYVKGIRDYANAFDKGRDKDSVISILTQHSSLKDPTVYQEMVMPGLNPDGLVSLEEIVSQVNWYKARGLVKEAPDPQSIVDNQYARFALEQLEPYR